MSEKLHEQSKYKLPLTPQEQIDLLGELMSARARIKTLEASIATITIVVQDVMADLKMMEAREKERLESHFILEQNKKTTL